MSLVVCHECKKEVSNKARQCTNCGAPVKLDNAQAAGQAALWMVIIVMVMIVVGIGILMSQY